MTGLALNMIRVYQLTWSKYTHPSCRFSPTCSQYTYEAIERYGLLRGIYMGMRRILRCHPFSQGGFDPVP